jgi:hypothetical protein
MIAKPKETGASLQGMASSPLWMAWAGLAVLLTANLFLWEVNYFDRPGRAAGWALLAFAVISAAGGAIYAQLRLRALWRFEPAVLATIALAALLFSSPRAALTVFALYLASYTLGTHVSGWIGLELPGPLERIAVHCGLGFGGLVLFLFVLGELRLFYPATFAALLAALILLGGRHSLAALSDVRNLNERWMQCPALKSAFVGTGIAFAFAATLSAVLVIVAPSITFDTLWVHLPIVHEHAATHSIAAFPEISYSYYPQGAETLWTMCYSLAGQAAPQMISALLFPLFLLVVLLLARECSFDPVSSVTGALWLGTLPFVHWTGSVMKNDMLLAFFQGLALYACLRWLQEPRLHWLTISVFFLAQSFGVKLVALFGSIPLVVFYLYAVWKQPPRWKTASALLVTFAAFGTFWAIRAYMLTGNPVYPEAAVTAVNSAAHTHGHSAANQLIRFASIPWAIFFEGGRTFESPLISPAGIIPLLFLPLAPLGVRRTANRALFVCLGFMILYLAYWANVLSTLRYAIVPFAILALTLARSAVLFYDSRRSNAVRGSILGIQIYCLLFALLGIFIIEVNVPEIAFLAGRLNRSSFLHSALRTYGSLEFLKSVAKPGEPIFGIDNCSRAYAPNPLQFSCVLCPGDCELGELRAKMDQQPPRYLIVGEERRPEGITGILEADSWMKIYHDEYFSVYERRP